MNTHALELKRRFVEALGRSALEYIEAGFDLFHRHRTSRSSCSHVAFGNLAVGLELALKCVLAEKNLGAVFRNMPSEARIFLAAPERIPEFFRWRNAAIDLSSDAYGTIGLSDCLDGYYVFAPHMKQLLLPHLSFIASRAEASLRTSLPALATYEFEKSGYAVLQTIISLEGDEAYAGSIAYAPGEEDRHFLDDFSAKRIERVSLALEQARYTASSRTAEEHPAAWKPEDWNSLAVPCPVCSGVGTLEGYNELSIFGNDEEYEPGLDFFAVSYHCSTCGLTLYDLEELKLAGMAMIYDRSDKLDIWMGTHGGIADW